VIGPPLRAAGRVRDRDHTGHQRSYHVDRAVAPDPVDLPISSDEVRRIASKGYPLWEPIEVMQLRNRRITLAYGDLSRRLARLLARDGPAQANWCTFATWSSKTIGNWIERDPTPDALTGPTRLPRFLVRWLTELTQYLVRRDNGATYRSLAAGNRYVFLEIGLAIARFLEAFEPGDEAGPDEPSWTAYWDGMLRVLAELSQLDPSWLLTEAPPPEDLRLGLRKYYEAMFVADPKERAELVLAGNLLIGAYEQRRVDGYVTASLALFTGRAMRRLVQRRFGPVGGWRRWPSALYARAMSRFLVLSTADEELRVSRPLPHPSGSPMFPEDLQVVTTPLVQALLTRYDLSDGKPGGRRVRDWTSLDDRMNYITNLFRSRQQHEPLFTAPFPPEDARKLLAGQLAPDATTSIPAGPRVPLVITTAAAPTESLPGAASG
jgi:hypothetical protein